MLKSYLVHNQDRYQIDYRLTGSRYELFALIRPIDPHRGRVLECHVYDSGKICVAAGQEPTTMDRAEAIAHMWMHGYSAYIRDPQGKFPNGACRVNV